MNKSKWNLEVFSWSFSHFRTADLNISLYAVDECSFHHFRGVNFKILEDEMTKFFGWLTSPFIFMFCQTVGLVFQPWYGSWRGRANIWLNWQFSRENCFCFYNKFVSVKHFKWIKNEKYAKFFWGSAPILLVF